MASLPAAQVGQGYLVAVAAAAPAPGSGDHWWLTAGELPAGLTLSANGAISGTPTMAGESTLTIAVGVGFTSMASRTFILTVDPATPPPPSPPPPSPPPPSPPLPSPPPVVTPAPTGLPVGTAPPATNAPRPAAAPSRPAPTSPSSGSTKASGGRGGSGGGGPSTTPTNVAATPAAVGYWLATANGGVYPHGTVAVFPAATPPAPGQSDASVVSVSPTPDAKGYWLARQDGTVTAYGDAPTLSSASTPPAGITAPAVRLVSTFDGMGYWMVTANGAVFAFGDAKYFGAGPPGPLQPSVVSLVPTPDDAGYWLATSTGAVYPFGDAKSFGAADTVALSSPVVAMAATLDGQGYWLATASGKVFGFGDARFLGSGASQGLTGTVSGITTTSDGQGYWLATTAGGVYPFGDAAPYANPVPDALTAPVVDMATPAASPLAQVPMSYVQADHAAAATCPGLPWSTLTGIAFMESDFGRSTLPGVSSGANFAGAAGPMQMGIKGAAGRTFQAYDHPVAGDPAPTVNGANPPSPYNLNDAVFAAARDLCSSGGGSLATLRRAVLAYNHSDSYADQVLALTRAYLQPPAAGSQAAVEVALTQLGVPYTWGGATPARGFDCSGLVQWVYARVGINLPRTSQDQWAALTHLPPGTGLMPGDLVFFGPANGPTHVGIYIGNGLMVDAPHTGAAVRIEADNWSDYVGATTP